jgi:para-nitrobenzyl esterase
MLSLLLLFCSCQIALAATCQAQTTYGPITGLVIGSHQRYQGVPFASPPLPPLRWRNPVAPGNWSSPLDCRNFTIGCAQTAHSLDVPRNTSEDCLYLEIYAPLPGRFATKASVIMWMYGGDWHEGGESFTLYNGRYLAEEQNVMLVNVLREMCIAFLTCSIGCNQLSSCCIGVPVSCILG